MNLQIACADNVSQLENLKAINIDTFNTVILCDLCYYLIRKPYYPGKNRSMPDRLRYFVHFLDFKMYSASRGPPCDSAASCFLISDTVYACVQVCINAFIERYFYG